MKIASVYYVTTRGLGVMPEQPHRTPLAPKPMQLLIVQKYGFIIHIIIIPLITNSDMKNLPTKDFADYPILLI